MTQSSDDEQSNLAFSSFFAAYQQFSSERDELMEQGHHDFNPLTAIRKANSEELHSSFIHTLINPEGKHYQGTRFLKLFLDMLGLESMDLENTVVKKEHSPRDTRRRIDLYISDGHHHVIVENKLYGPDQFRQAQDYIERMRDKDGSSPPECVHFVYLTLKDSDPDKKSLGDYKIEGQEALWQKMVDADNNPQARYRRITFKKHLLPWVEQCLMSVKDKKSAEGTIDLWFILNEYKKVVLTVTKNKTPSVPTLSDFLEADSNQATERYQHALKIQKALPSVQTKWLSEALLEQIPTLVKEQFGELIQAGPEVLPKLKGRFFSSGDAEARFSSGVNKQPPKANRNKGVLWISEETSLGFPVALGVLYGKKYLHIGLMPLIKEGEVFSTDPNDEKIGAIKKYVNASQNISKIMQPMKQHDEINPLFPGLVSGRKDLDDCMVELSDVENSPLWAMIQELVELIRWR